VKAQESKKGTRRAPVRLVRARTEIIEFIVARARQGRFQIPATGVDVLETARLVQRQYTSLQSLPMLPAQFCVGASTRSPACAAASTRRLS
jgi:hypothetical protein